MLLVLAFEAHGLVGLLAVAHTVRQSNQILHVTELRERSRDCRARAQRPGPNFCDLTAYAQRFT